MSGTGGKPLRPRKRGVKPLIVMAVVVSLLVVGAAYQVIATSVQMAQHPPPGQFIDVGGYRIHLYCTGEGSPTVLLFHAMGTNIYNWAKVQPEVATLTRVCSFDRPGYGWSDPGPAPRSPLQAVKETHVLLEKAGIAGPYVLVGHSWGTSTAQMYADQYPDEVVGLVLLDDVFSREGVQLCEEANHEQLAGNRLNLACMPRTARIGTDIFVAVQPALVRVGLLRVLGGIQPYGENLKFFSPQELDTFNVLSAQTKTSDTSSAEWSNWDMLVGQVGEAGSLRDWPLVIISSENTFPDYAYGGESDKWKQLNEANLEAARALSSNSQIVIVPGADHASLVFNPEHLRFVVEAIRDLVEGARAP